MQILVVGAGVVGLAIARAAALAGHDVTVAEATGGIGNGVSSRNSEVIHAGIYYPTGSLRARHCTHGRRMLYEFCATHGVGHNKCGKLIVATDTAELAKVEALLAQGLKNGVEGLELIGGNAARALEAELSCIGALLSPESGIVDSHGFMLALWGELEDRGGMIAFETPVERLSLAGSQWRAQFGGRDAGAVAFDAVVNAAGLGAQALARRIEGYPPDKVPRLVLAKGNYFGFAGRPVFSRLIYPTQVDGCSACTSPSTLPDACGSVPMSNGSRRKATRSIPGGPTPSMTASAPTGPACRQARSYRTIAESGRSLPARASRRRIS